MPLAFFFLFFFFAKHDLDTFASEINVDLKKIETLSRQLDFQSWSLMIKTKRKKHKPLKSWYHFQQHPVKNALTKNIWECFLIAKLILMNILKKYLIKPVNVLPRLSLLQIHKSFAWSYLDYSNIIFDKAFVRSFQQKLHSIQYNATLAITGTIKGIFRE